MRLMKNRLISEMALLFRPNRYSWVGAALGMISVLFLTWIYVPPTWMLGRSLTPAAYDIVKWTLPFHSDWSYADLLVHGAVALHLPLLLFLIGTVMAFVTPLGGILQIGGLAWFASSFINPIYDGFDWYFDMGFYVALFSSAFVMCAWRMRTDHALDNRAVLNIGRVAAIQPHIVGLQR